MFTLIEPWMKHSSILAREIAVTILQTILKTYLERVEFKVGDPTSFSPGPIIVGSVVPRCFDSSSSVQSVALKCLKLAIRILATYEGHAEENIEQMLAKLKSLSVMSPSHDDAPVNRYVTKAS